MALFTRVPGLQRFHIDGKRHIAGTGFHIKIIKAQIHIRRIRQGSELHTHLLELRRADGIDGLSVPPPP